MVVSRHDDEVMPRRAPREAPPRLPDPAELDVAHPPDCIRDGLPRPPPPLLPPPLALLVGCTRALRWPALP
jgi:hypothetical protein